MTTKLTSAQIVALGEYLNPDFDPSSLTVSQLLGVLGYHNVTWPTPYSKPKLIQRFEEEIKSKSTKLKRERLKKANSIASDDGITDGLTGKPLSKAPPPRRSSRRLSKIPAATTDDEASSPVRPEPVKRRRSSAQPVLGGATSRRKARPEVDAIQETDSETEELPVKKVGRTKKKADASSQARRISLAEDSGWEDNNIFQSGAEDSSPARPTPTRPKASRKSVGARKSRKSFSAPPQSPPPASPIQLKSPQGRPSFSPQAAEFKPDLPFLPNRDFRLPPKSPLAKPVKEASPEDTDVFEPEQEQGAQDHEDVRESPHFPEPIREESVSAEEKKLSEERELSQAEEQRKAISRRVAASVEEIRLHPASLPTEQPSWLMRFILVGICSIIAYYVHDYKVQSAAIGYCDAGTRTSRAVEEVKAHHLLVKECNRENRTSLYPLNDAASGQDPTACPLLPVLPIPPPESCTPCPEHAACSQFSVSCDTGHLLQPNPLLFFLPTPPSASNISLATASSSTEFIWGAVFDTLNGLPGLGSIALPPRCLEDPQRKARISALGREIEVRLGKERGRRVCAGGKNVQDHVKKSDGGEAKQWGIELSELKESLRKITPVKLLPAFEDTFNNSLQELVRWGGIIIGEDKEGHRYLAHKTPQFTWKCTLLVKSRETWAQWRSTVFSTLAMIFGVIIARLRYVRNKVESRHVAELVSIALESLRRQEIAHHTDPVTEPQPYLSSLQLRDLILQEEHSVSVRRRLWDRVERVVEGNANVRVNMEEVEGGDELRVWRWVGSSRGSRVEGPESNVSSPYASPKAPIDRS
ncbi:hypothetical protein NP233_g2098 [Leucocoprinus birnbaumii]|uniref:Inner nuclear membrane protein SRC1 n=1 Tax=Leucocoprinus birnbaumii TaxID=56174 RepID=A0AAD5W0Y0_9AGAR|nr:hypothetical protein NP233_g2098 [Leucocoprinus birnbaumii]